MHPKEVIQDLFDKGPEPETDAAGSKSWGEVTLIGLVYSKKTQVLEEMVRSVCDSTITLPVRMKRISCFPKACDNDRFVYLRAGWEI